MAGKFVGTGAIQAPAPVITGSARKTRTLYVREEDQEIWDEAKEVVGDSLSTYITKHLKHLVATKKAETKGFERIVLKLTEKRRPQAKAFHGRWIIAPNCPWETRDEETGEPDHYAVAVTPKNNVVVFNFWGSDFEYPGGRFLVYESFEAASQDSSVPEFLITEVLKREGVPVQELDI